MKCEVWLLIYFLLIAGMSEAETPVWGGKYLQANAWVDNTLTRQSCLAWAIHVDKYIHIYYYLSNIFIDVICILLLFFTYIPSHVVDIYYTFPIKNVQLKNKKKYIQKHVFWMLYIYRMYSVVVDTRVGQWVLVQVKGECRCGWWGEGG